MNDRLMKEFQKGLEKEKRVQCEYVKNNAYPTHKFIQNYLKKIDRKDYLKLYNIEVHNACSNMYNSPYTKHIILENAKIIYDIGSFDTLQAAYYIMQAVFMGAKDPIVHGTMCAIREYFPEATNGEWQN